MGLFDKLKKLFSADKYKVNRDILKDYIEQTINFSLENQLAFGDEFFIAASPDTKDRIHVSILNYDAPLKHDDENLFEIEDTFNGVIIFANYEKSYDPESDHKYTRAEDFISQELSTMPDEFYVFVENEPTMLAPYKEN